MYWLNCWLIFSIEGRKFWHQDARCVCHGISANDVCVWFTAAQWRSFGQSAAETATTETCRSVQTCRRTINSIKLCRKVYKVMPSAIDMISITCCVFSYSSFLAAAFKLCNSILNCSTILSLLSLLASNFRAVFGHLYRKCTLSFVSFCSVNYGFPWLLHWVICSSITLSDQ